jgi:hypothetical protein
MWRKKGPHHNKNVKMKFTQRQQQLMEAVTQLGPVRER